MHHADVDDFEVKQPCVAKGTLALVVVVLSGVLQQAEGFVVALKLNRSVTYLDLSHNFIGGEADNPFPVLAKP